MAEFDDKSGDMIPSVGRREVHTPAVFIGAFIAGEPVYVPPEAELYFRFIRVRPEDRTNPAVTGSDARLANDARRLAFVAAADCATAVTGLPVEPTLYTIGWSPDYVDELHQRGIDVDLAAWNGHGDARLADWENVLTRICEEYAEFPALIDDIRWHWDVLSTWSFDQYGLDGVALDKIEAAGPSHPRHMSLSGYLEGIPLEARRANPQFLRMLLVFMEHLGPLFTGTGRSLDGFDEYIVQNQTLSSLDNFARQTVLHNNPDSAQ